MLSRSTKSIKSFGRTTKQNLMAASIHSERLDLIPMTPAFLRASLARNVPEAEQLSLRLKQLEVF